MIGPSVLGLVEPERDARGVRRARRRVPAVLGRPGDAAVGHARGRAARPRAVGVARRRGAVRRPATRGRRRSARAPRRSVFIGAALVATSVGITSAVLIELGALGTRAARDDPRRRGDRRHPRDGAARGRGRRRPRRAASTSPSILVVVALAVGVRRVRRARRHAGRRALARRLPRAAVLRVAAAARRDPVPRPRRVRRADRPRGDHRRVPRRAWSSPRPRTSTTIEEEVAPLYAFFPPFFFAFIGIAGRSRRVRRRRDARRCWPA